MEFALIVAGLAALVFAYFCFGIIIRWIWEWWIILFAAPFLLFAGLWLGWMGAIVALVGACVALAANNSWHSNSLYIRVSEKIEKAFYFGDT